MWVCKNLCLDQSDPQFISQTNSGLIAVRFTAVKGDGYKSDVALDDVIFSAGCGSRLECHRTPEFAPVFGDEDGVGPHLSITGGLVQGGVSHASRATGHATFLYNRWNHVALQYNGRTKQQILFFNGKADSITNNVQIKPSCRNLLLGRDDGKYFQGQIDEVRLWKAAVNVTETYNKYPHTPSQLAHHYRFNTGKGSWLKDSKNPSKGIRLLRGTKWVTSSLELKSTP
ncbi:predicted protein [Nematostella vectensis]|uniref:Pentaxin n=1 Tax=Nematostella vectensis TaxID=45351 RepID=A7S2C4_NEMVE|nr:predicted protein [Nematostella vectensis]|eukprot:XP_001634181.1 predicted protein [Nematostella vectensis]